MKTYYTVDDDIDVQGYETLAEASEAATELKKAHPLRTIYISRVINGINGEETTVIAEA